MSIIMAEVSFTEQDVKVPLLNVISLSKYISSFIFLGGVQHSMFSQFYLSLKTIKYLQLKQMFYPNISYEANAIGSAIDY